MEQSISNFRVVGVCVCVFPNFKIRRFCKQIVKFLIRHRIIGCLIWICTVFLCPMKRMLGLYGLKEPSHLKVYFQLPTYILIGKQNYLAIHINISNVHNFSDGYFFTQTPYFACNPILIYFGNHIEKINFISLTHISPTIFLWNIYRQTVRTQIRCRNMRHLIRVSTVYLQNVQLKFEKKNEKYHPTTLKMDWTGPIYKSGQFHSA